jgi:hypothetical protein
MKDKKKMILLIALAVLVLGIGAFQFVNSSGGDKPQPKPTAKKEPAAEPDGQQTEVDPAMQYVVSNATPHDPFQEGVLPLAEGQTPPPRDPPRINSRPSGNGFKIPDSVGGGFELTNPLKPNVPDGIGIQHVQAFDVIGAIVGEHPAAVFVDENGRQRLVTVGGSFGDDRHLVSVDGDRVTVRHGEKTITYTVGGTPNAK